jgi:hypothetical protein
MIGRAARKRRRDFILGSGENSVRKGDYFQV